MPATATVARTRAEEAILRNFETAAAQLPGGRAVADARRAAIHAFAEQGLPHRRIEEWKYSDLRSSLKDALAPATAAAALTPAALDAALGGLATLDADRVVLVDGCYRADLSRLPQGAGIEITPLAQALGRPGVGLLHDDPPGHAAIVALNTAFVTDGAVVRVGQNAAVARPLLLVAVRANPQGAQVTTRNIVSVAAGARATLIEAHLALAGAAGQDNTLSDIAVGEGASLAHVKVTLAGRDGSHHLGTALVKLEKDASYRSFQLTAASAFVRNTTFLTYGGEGAKVDISGVFVGRGNEHIDTTLVIDHAVPACESRELFKGVLADRARGIFQGKVIVRPDAQKTDGKQMAQALMLSEDAEFDSKPELEIYADDVVCGHGSTAAELDEELLFYMRSRGIGKAAARALLIESFIGEAIDKVEHDELREVLRGIALSSLDTAG